MSGESVIAIILLCSAFALGAAIGGPIGFWRGWAHAERNCEALGCYRPSRCKCGKDAK